LFGRWTRPLAALGTILLLAPAPVLAFTWLNAWTASGGSTGGAPTPTFASSDGGKPPAQNGTLQVDPGKFFSTGVPATSTIEVTRTLQLAADREQVMVTNLFQVFLQNARVRMRISFVPVTKGGAAHTKSFFWLTRLVGNNHDTAKLVTNNPDHPSKTKKLRQGFDGKYVVHVLIRYNTAFSLKNTNQWVAGSKTASAHTITFQSL